MVKKIIGARINRTIASPYATLRLRELPGARISKVRLTVAWINGLFLILFLLDETYLSSEVNFRPTLMAIHNLLHHEFTV